VTDPYPGGAIPLLYGPITLLEVCGPYCGICVEEISDATAALIAAALVNSSAPT
jgi:hypothetical protein